jgi:hypothetical protein
MKKFRKKTICAAIFASILLCSTPSFAGIPSIKDLITAIETAISSAIKPILTDIINLTAAESAEIAAAETLIVDAAKEIQTTTGINAIGIMKSLSPYALATKAEQLAEIGLHDIVSVATYTAKEQIKALKAVTTIVDAGLPPAPSPASIGCLNAKGQPRTPECTLYVKSYQHRHMAQTIVNHAVSRQISNRMGTIVKKVVNGKNIMASKVEMLALKDSKAASSKFKGIPIIGKLPAIFGVLQNLKHTINTAAAQFNDVHNILMSIHTDLQAFTHPQHAEKAQSAKQSMAAYRAANPGSS